MAVMQVATQMICMQVVHKIPSVYLSSSRLIRSRTSLNPADRLTRPGLAGPANAGNRTGVRVGDTGIVGRAVVSAAEGELFTDAFGEGGMATVVGISIHSCRATTLMLRKNGQSSVRS